MKKIVETDLILKKLLDRIDIYTDAACRTSDSEIADGFMSKIEELRSIANLIMSLSREQE